MPKGVRYTQEQKEKIKQEALVMLNKGEKQKDVAAKLGVAPATLNKLLEGESFPGQRKKSGRSAAAKLPGLDADNPVLQMAVKRQRVQEIASEIEALTAEKASLEDEMKALYKEVGKELFGK